MEKITITVSEYEELLEHKTQNLARTAAIKKRNASEAAKQARARWTERNPEYIRNYYREYRRKKKEILGG